MIWYFGLSFFVALMYIIHIRHLVQGWRSIQAWQAPPEYDPTVFVSVLVCARNEEKVISDCLKSLCNQSYPSHLYEVILLDNHSSDSTLAIAKDLGLPQIRIVELAEALDEKQTFKKQAISYGLDLAKGEWIMMTDADCVVPHDWIRSCISFAEITGKKALAGPVQIITSPNYLGKYQQIDMAGLMIATGGGLSNGSLLSANGANLAYRRETLNTTAPIVDSNRFASGDDIFLIQAIHRHSPGAVSFLKSRAAIVKTQGLSTWRKFFSQRRRWASKSRHLPHAKTKLVTTVVWVNAFLILSHLLLAIFVDKWYGALLAVHLMMKSLADGYLLREGMHFFDIRQDWKQQVFNMIFNPLYITITGLSVLIKPRYYWKGRNVQ